MGQITRAEGQRGPGAHNALNRSLKRALEPPAAAGGGAAAVSSFHAHPSSTSLPLVRSKMNYSPRHNVHYWDWGEKKEQTKEKKNPLNGEYLS